MYTEAHAVGHDAAAEVNVLYCVVAAHAKLVLLVERHPLSVPGQGVEDASFPWTTRDCKEQPRALQMKVGLDKEGLASYPSRPLTSSEVAVQLRAAPQKWQSKQRLLNADQKEGCSSTAFACIVVVVLLPDETQHPVCLCPQTSCGAVNCPGGSSIQRRAARTASACCCQTKLNTLCVCALRPAVGQPRVQAGAALQQELLGYVLSEKKKAMSCASVPSGQLWGSPLYKWEQHRKEGYSWWASRLGRAFELYDETRIDHFRGFAGVHVLGTASAGCCDVKVIPVEMFLQWR
eukprot:1155989-Pelagomonas_calceolata.AAC.1